MGASLNQENNTEILPDNDSENEFIEEFSGVDRVFVVAEEAKFYNK